MLDFLFGPNDFSLIYYYHCKRGHLPEPDGLFLISCDDVLTNARTISNILPNFPMYLQNPGDDFTFWQIKR